MINIIVLNDGSLGEFGVVVFAVAVLEVVREEVLRMRRRQSVVAVAVVVADQNVVERRNVRRRKFRFSSRSSKKLVGHFFRRTVVREGRADLFEFLSEISILKLCFTLVNMFL